MITKYDLDIGGDVVAAYEALKSAREPDSPKLRILQDMPRTPAVFRVFKDENNIEDHESIVKAYFDAILTSDHPMIRAELKKLYMLGKLALDAEDPIIDRAVAEVRAIEKTNAVITDSNDAERARYENDLKIRKANLETSKEAVNKWWDKFVDQIENTYNSGSIVWRDVIKTAFINTAACEIIKFKPNFRSKNINLSNLKTVNWPDHNQMHRFANLFKKNVENAHRNFINTEHSIIVKQLQDSKEYRFDLRQIKLKYDVEHHRTTGGMKRIKAPDNTWIYVNTKGYSNEYHYNPFYDYDDYRALSSRNRNWEDYMEEMHWEIRKLDDRVMNLADEMIYERHRAGDDGYEIIYSSPKREQRVEKDDIYYNDKFKSY